MKLAHLVRDLWEPRRRPLLYALAVFAVGISVNVISAWVEERPVPRWAFGAGVPLALLALLASPWFERMWTREPVPTLVPARPCKGLVVLVSAGVGSATARAAIDHHAGALEFLWVVCSQASRAEAERILDETAGRPGFVRERLVRLLLSDAEFDDPGRVREALEIGVFDELPAGLLEGDVVLDVTGGRRNTGLGAFLVGLPPGRRLEYVAAAETDENLRGTRAGAPVEIVLQYKLRSAAGRSR